VALNTGRQPRRQPVISRASRFAVDSWDDQENRFCLMVGEGENSYATNLLFPVIVSYFRFSLPTSLPSWKKQIALESRHV
jgi:hypothetical protein